MTTDHYPVELIDTVWSDGFGVAGRVGGAELCREVVECRQPAITLGRNQNARLGSRSYDDDWYLVVDSYHGRFKVKQEEIFD
jgi:hypothetical protein